MRKLISALLVFSLLLIPCSTALALDYPNVPVRPSIESILREYQIQALTASNSGISTCAVQGTLQENNFTQQAVDALTEAGYEAYNVNSSTYTSVSKALNTDLSQFGLVDGNSYVVVIGGNDPETSLSTNDLLLPPHEYEPPTSGTGIFYHTYNGTTYTLRNVTVSQSSCNINDELDYLKVGSSPISNLSTASFSSHWLQCYMSLMSRYSTTVSTLARILDAFAGIVDNPSSNLVDMEAMVLFGSVAWTREFIEVWDESTSSWVCWYSSAYAISSSYCSGYKYNSATHAAEPVQSKIYTQTIYSRLYNSTERYDNAVQCYLWSDFDCDTTGDVEFGIQYEGKYVKLFELQDEYYYKYAGFFT